MLFLPLLDRAWVPPHLPRTRLHILSWLTLLVVATLPAIWTPGYFALVLTNLLLVALPEEWFFRAYFMARLGQGIRANVISSLLFSLLHGLTRGWITAALVFAPSIFYGWLYQRTRDMPLLTLVHALSNLVYAAFLAELVATFIRNLR